MTWDKPTSQHCLPGAYLAPEHWQSSWMRKLVCIYQGCLNVTDTKPDHWLFCEKCNHRTNTPFYHGNYCYHHIYIAEHVYRERIAGKKNKRQLENWLRLRYVMNTESGRVQWRHNGCDSVSNHQPHNCLIKRLFRRRSKETSKLRVTGLCEGSSPVTGEFPAQMVSNAENVSIWWRHHETGAWWSHQGSQICM